MKKYFFYFITISYLFVSCEKDKVQQIDDDLNYLSINGDINDPIIQWENIEVYRKAYSRMFHNIDVVNNKLFWTIKNGYELNISEDIYDYVIKFWEIINEKIENDELYIKLTTDSLEFFYLKNEINSRSYYIKKQLMNTANIYNCKWNVKQLYDIYNEAKSGEKLSYYLNDLEMGTTNHIAVSMASGNLSNKPWFYYVILNESNDIFVIIHKQTISSSDWYRMYNSDGSKLVEMQNPLTIINYTN